MADYHRRFLTSLLLFLSYFSIRVYPIGKSPVISGYEFFTDPVIHVYSTLDSKDASNNLFKRNYGKNVALGDVKENDIFQMDFRAYNQTYRLVLEPNRNLVHPDATITIHKRDGRSQVLPLTTDGVGYYVGHAILLEDNFKSNAFTRWEASLRKRNQFFFDEKENYARISIDNKSGQPLLDGTMFVNGESYHIKPISIYEKTKRSFDPAVTSLGRRSEETRQAQNIIYRHSDFLSYDLNGSSGGGENRGCGAKSLEKRYPFGSSEPKYLFDSLSTNALFRKRQSGTFADQLAISAGCSTGKKVLYMGAAADCTYITLHGGAENARKQILSNWNQASATYERQLNVALGLIYIEAVDGVCPSTPDPERLWNRDCSQSYAISSRLSDFSAWRGKRSSDSAGLWHLMTNCPTGSDVGLAWLGAICQKNSLQNPDGTSFSGTGISAATRDEWKIVAHEVGHNFGASHDCTTGTCNNGNPVDCCPCTTSCDCNGQFIMNPSSPVATNNFSPCSVQKMCNTIGSKARSCLSDPGTKPTIGTAMCGNGIVEDGEECDCGTEEICTNDPCCDAKTCKFKSGAKCSDKNNSCCKNCQVLSSGTVCRAKASECDVEEVCDGVNADCPKDSHVNDGTDCSGDISGTKCASGVCTSRDAQCKATAGNEGYTNYCKIGVYRNLCDIQCQSPRSSRTCIAIPGSFIEGTKCGLNAYCRNGSCKGTNWFYTFLLFFQQSLYITIPIGIFVGLIILYILYSLLKAIFFMLFGSCMKKRTPNPPNTFVMGNLHPPPGVPYYGYNQNPNQAIDPDVVYPQPIPPVQNQYGPDLNGYTQNANIQHSNWVDPSPYNGPDYGRRT